MPGGGNAQYGIGGIAWADSVEELVVFSMPRTISYPLIAASNSLASTNCSYTSILTELMIYSISVGFFFFYTENGYYL